MLQLPESWAGIDAHGLAYRATVPCWGDSLTQMQEWTIFAPANLQGTNWEFLLEAL